VKGLRVVTGYAEEPGLAAAVDVVALKPVELQQLAADVRRLLDGARGPARGA